MEKILNKYLIKWLNFYDVFYIKITKTGNFNTGFMKKVKIKWEKEYYILF